MNATAALRFSVCGLAAAFAVALPLSASAGPLRINFGPSGPDDDTQFDWNGSFDDQIDVSDGTFEGTLAPFPGPNMPASDLAGPPAGTAGAFSAGLHIGDFFYNSFCIAEQGRVWFASGGAGACASDFNAADVALFSVFGGAWDYTFDPTTAATEGPSVSVSLGLEDRDLDGSGSTLANADPVLRVFWRALSTGDAAIPLIDLQALFYDLGGGDFDVAFNYGGNYTALGGTQAISAPGIAGYAGIPALIGAATDPFFRFRDGVFSLSGAVDPDPTPVPEPGTLWLLVAGAALLLLRRPSRATQVAR
jgi:hypothetical protein